MKRLLVFCSIPWLLGLSNVMAAGGDVWLAPQSPSVATGAPLTLESRVDSGSSKVGAYTFNITFDPARLQVKTSQCDNGVCLGPDALSTNFVNTDNTNGTIVVSGFDTNGEGPSSNLHLLTIHFTAGTTAGITPVDITITTLASELGQTIGTPNGRGSSVTISSTGDPDPCPPQTALVRQPDRSGMLDLLYQVRDQVLAASTDGQWLTDVFYRHAREVSARLVAEPRLGLEALGLIRMLRSDFEQAVAGRKPQLNVQESAAIRDFARALQRGASPELAADLEHFLSMDWGSLAR